MKCPKCGYLGFETSDRCRNCGYDFSLAVSTAPAPELPLQPGEAGAVPLADYSLAPAAAAPLKPTPALDLDRLIGGADEAGARPAPDSSGVRETPPPARPPQAAVDRAESDAAQTSPMLRRARSGPLAAAQSQPPQSPAPEPAADTAANEELPLFEPPGSDMLDDTPLITAPGPVRPPLAVRRATPDVPRGRSRTRITPRHDEPGLALEPGGSEAAASEPAAPAAARAVAEGRPAGIVPRTLAMLIDALLLGAIDAGVLYFTLAIAGLTFAEVRQLPPIPLIAFLLILDGGYLIVFTTAGGQTIGKMLAGLRVMGDDDRRVDTAGAVLRAVGCLVTLLTLGLGYLPVFFSAEGRTLHDRIAGTRVVKRDETWQ
jgi:uncharacterized RDD family membrane protein YckC